MPKSEILEHIRRYVHPFGSLGLAYPKVDAARKKELAATRAALARDR